MDDRTPPPQNRAEWRQFMARNNDLLAQHQAANAANAAAAPAAPAAQGAANQGGLATPPPTPERPAQNNPFQRLPSPPRRLPER